MARLEVLDSNLKDSVGKCGRFFSEHPLFLSLEGNEKGNKNRRNPFLVLQGNEKAKNRRNSLLVSKGNEKGKDMRNPDFGFKGNRKEKEELGFWFFGF